MHPELLEYYNRELQHLRAMGGEFARAHPKIAGRLGLDAFECVDPYVERLLEGFSFLAARIQLKQDASFAPFTQQLLQLIYPHYLAPTPSMMVVQFQPDLTHPRLVDGIKVARHTVLHSRSSTAGHGRCTYRTAHALTLWPITLTRAEYLRFSPLATDIQVDRRRPVRALLRLSFDITGHGQGKPLMLATLPLYLRGADALPARLYEHLLAHQCGALLRCGEAQYPLPLLRPLGFEPDQALLPPARRVFQGYRLLQEYFALPERYLFVEQTGLQAALAANARQSFELIWLFDRHDAWLEQTLNASHFALFATPAINLFPMRSARMPLANERFEHHVVPDPTRPQDYEVYQIDAVRAYGDHGQEAQRFAPFYQAYDLQQPEEGRAYYQLRRELCAASTKQASQGARSRYAASEVYLALVDSQQAPYAQHLRQLGLDLWCSNRDLPLLMPLGHSDSDFTLEQECFVRTVRCIAGPSQPRPMRADGKVSWRLLQHLSLNYLSLAVSDAESALVALKNLLALYCPAEDHAAQHQIDGLCAMSSRTVTRRLPHAGPIAFARGLEVTLTLDDHAFEGSTAFLLASVLQRFLADSVSINSFAEIVVKSRTRGDIMRWPAWGGMCPIL